VLADRQALVAPRAGAGSNAPPSRLHWKPHQELTDLDATAEALERSMSSLQAMLKKLPGI
jgi:hypothetical protein